MSWSERMLRLGNFPLVLASASPRRASLLEELGVPFERRPVDFSEALLPGERPEEAVVRLATEKARAAARPGEHAWIVAADTLVVLDGTPLGKPRTTNEAREMLGRLSGRAHEVVTGVAVLTPEGSLRSGLEQTTVRFATLSNEEIDALVDSGEAMDKAGAYGIQGLASFLIEGIEGDYFNVVGLPLRLLKKVLTEAPEEERTWEGGA